MMKKSLLPTQLLTLPIQTDNILQIARLFEKKSNRIMLL